MTDNHKPTSSKANEYQFLYSSLVGLRNTELTIYWTRYNILSAINFALLAVGFSAGDASFVVANRTLTAVGGLLIAVIWLLITVKGKQLLIERWDRNIEIYEEQCITDPDLRLFTRVLQNESKNWFRKRWDNLNILAGSLPVLCIVAWVILVAQ